MTRSHRRVSPAQVSGWAREIVAKRVLILAALAAVCHVLVLTGTVPDGFSEQAEVSAVLWVRSGVTPADPALAPRSTAGLPLVVADPGGHVHRASPAREDLRDQLAKPED